MPPSREGLRMNRLTINLENCYGIKKLAYTFDFGDSNVYAIYAPNGSMKTSLALTFQAVAEGRKPEDRLYRDRVTRCDILDENGKELSKNDIVVLTPYREPLEQMENTQILLVNSKLREQYDRLHSDTEKAKKALLKAIKHKTKGIDAKKNCPHLLPERRAIFTSRLIVSGRNCKARPILPTQICRMTRCSTRKCLR